jgi:hypothetical protein
MRSKDQQRALRPLGKLAERSGMKRQRRIKRKQRSFPWGTYWDRTVSALAMIGTWVAVALMLYGK